QGLDDIKYHFLIDDKGFIYEGRGWSVDGVYAAGVHAKCIGTIYCCTIPLQSCWLMPITDIALIGDFTKTEPSEVAQQSLNKLFLCGISSHMLRRTSRLIVAPFRCGRAFYEMFDSCQCFCDYELE
ncbi:hypothetical protein LSH36_649g01003, partial [Paralvinella palmiformis]